MPKAGIVIAVDGERQFSQAMRTAKNEASNMKAKLQEVKAQFADNANSMEALTAKQQALTETQEAYQKELEAAKDGQRNAREAVEKWKKAVEESAKALKEAKDRQEALKKEGKEGTEEYKKQEQAVKSLETQLEKESKALQQAYTTETKYTKQATSARKELDSLGQELEKTDRYMEEAKASTDGCATSIDQFGNEVKEAEQKTSSFGDVFKGTLASALTADALKSLALKAADLGKKLAGLAVEASVYADDMITASTVTGMSTERLQEYAYAADLIDTSLDTVTGALAKNVKSMSQAEKGSVEYKEAYKKLGVQITDVNGNLRDSESVFWDTIDALGKMENQTEADATAMTLFGKSAADLKPLITNGSSGFKVLADEARAAGAVLDKESIDKLGEVNDAYVRFQNSVEALKNTAGAKLADFVTPVLNGITSLLNGITNAINPPKTELEQFIADTETMHKDVQNLVKAANDTAKEGEAKAAELDVTAQKVKAIAEQFGLFEKVNPGAAAEKVRTAVSDMSPSLDEISTKTKAAKDSLEGFGNTSVSAPEDSTAEALTEWGKLGFGGLDALVQNAKGSLEGFGNTTVSVPEDSTAEALTEWGKLGFGGLDAIVQSTKQDVEGFKDTSVTAPGGGAAKPLTNFGEYYTDKIEKPITDAAEQVKGFGRTSVTAPEDTEGKLEGVRKLYDGITEGIGTAEDEISGFGTDLQPGVPDVTSVEGVQKPYEDISEKIGEAEEDLAGMGTAEVGIPDTSGLEGAMKAAADSVESDKARMMDPLTTYEFQNALDKLSASIPEIGEAWDPVTQKLSMTAEEFDRLIEKQHALLMMEAIDKAQATAVEAYAKAKLEAARADAVAERAQEAYTKAVAAANEEGQKTREQIIEETKAMDEAEVAIAAAAKAQREANNDMEAAQAVMEETDEVCASLKAQYANVVSATEEMSSAMEESVAVTEEVAKAYENMRDSIRDSIEDTVDLLDEFSGGEKKSADEIIKNLDSQIAGLNNWVKNMETLGQLAGSGMSQELYDALAEMGPEAANLVQELVDTLESDPEKFQKISEKYAEALKISDTAPLVASYTTAGKEAGAAYADEIEEAKRSAAESAATMASEAAGEMDPENNDVKGKGEDTASDFSEGIENNAGDAESAAVTMVSEALDAAAGEASGSTKVGLDFSSGIAQGILNGETMITSAARVVVNAGVEAARDEEDAHSPAKKLKVKVGEPFSQGIAEGIRAGEGAVEGASRKVVKAAIAAAKEEIEAAEVPKALQKKINSSFGVSTTDKNGDKKAAADYYGDILDAAEEALDNYQTLHHVTEAEQLAFWESVQGTLKKKSQAWYDAQKKINSLQEDILEEQVKTAEKAESDRKKQKEAEQKAEDARNRDTLKKLEAYVTKEKILRDMSAEEELAYWEKHIGDVDKGSDEYLEIYRKAKDLREEILSEEQAARADYLSQAEKYVSRQQILGLMDIRQELQYWQEKIKGTEVYSDEWYSIYRKINELSAEVQADAEKTAQAAVDEERNRLAELSGVHTKLLSSYRAYYNMSSRAEMQYWNIARKQFVEGTNERIEADRKYLDAKEAWYEELEKLDEEYREKSREISEGLSEEVDRLTQEYRDAVAERKASILSSFDLFSAWDNEGYTADAMLHNARTQVEGLRLWEEEMEALRDKDLPSQLLEQLEGMGPQATANIYTLNRMTSDELDEWVALWAEKEAVASRQAEEQSKGLLEETEEGISKARQEAEEAQEAAYREYLESLAAVNEEISPALEGLVKKAESTSQDMVAALVAGITGDEGKIRAATEELASRAGSGLEKLRSAGEEAGKAYMEELARAIADQKTAENTLTSMYRNMLAAADRPEWADIGRKIGDEMGKGIRESLDNLPAYSNGWQEGLNSLDRLTNVTAGAQTVVADMSAMSPLLSRILAAVQSIDGQMPDGTAGRIDTAVDESALMQVFSQGLAALSVRENGGTLL